MYSVDTGYSFNELRELMEVWLCYLSLHCRFGKPLSYAMAIHYIKQLEKKTEIILVKSNTKKLWFRQNKILRDASIFLSTIYNILIYQVIRENRELSTEDYKTESKILQMLYKYLTTFF